MNNLGVLYRFELKKLLKRKLVWIACIIALAAAVSSASADVTGEYFVDGELYDTHYNMMITDREYARALTGRKIDQELLEETQAAYRKVPTDVYRYSLTEEYQTYARPYSAIFQFIRKVMDMDELEDFLAWEPDEMELYDNYRKIKAEEGEKQYLTGAEKGFWQEKEEKTEKPIVFGYADGYWKMTSSSFTIFMILQLLITVCLSDIFTKEHTFRTDQLLLSSKLGKQEAYWAKALAGTTFAGGTAAVLILITLAIVFGIYGSDGADVTIQSVMPYYPHPLNAKETVIVIYAVMFIAALLISVFVMALSELLHNGTAVLAAVSGMILITMFVNIPAHLRVAAQIWSYIPSNLINTDTDGIFSLLLVRFFGGYLTIWQAAPILYILLSGVILWIGKRKYQGYQVSGR